MPLAAGAGVGDGAEPGRADELGVFPERAGAVDGGAGAVPALAALVELGVGEGDADLALDGVEGDHVAVAEERDRAALGRLGADVADAEAAGGAGEAAVGDERHLLAHALAGEGGGGGEHLAHAGAADRALVADDDDLALLVGALLHRLEGVLLAFEDAGGAGEDLLLGGHAGDLHDGALGGEVAHQADDAAGLGDRRVDRGRSPGRRPRRGRRRAPRRWCGRWR